MTDWQIPFGWALALVASLLLWTLLAFAAYGVYLLAT